ncbi:MAG: hypothetical protein PHO41_00205, partial [Eubacteriales bacterium]|nr:hypothetical protein [Eubacteriales bacterium]
SDNLSINGVNFVPDITPGNCVRLEGGDALMATLVNDDPQFFEGLEVGEPPIKENIFIRHGNAYLSLSDGPHVNLYEQAAKSTIRLLKKSMEEKGQSGNEDWNFSNYQAMKLLEGQKYSIKADGQPLVDIIIGSVVEVPPTPTVWQDDLTPPPYHDPSYDKVGEATNVCPHGRPIGQCEIPPCAPLVNP